MTGDVTGGMSRATIRAQAKLNLRLHVFERERGGHHGIETILHRIELGDDVTVSLAPPGECTIDCSADVGPDNENLAFRAAASFCRAANWETGFHIDLEKKVPAGAGLGGGSADAAAVLRILQLLAPNPLPGRTVLQLARALGADVPFLATDAVMALAWHHGERMMELPALPQRDIALVLPDFRVSTAQAYAGLGRDTGGISPWASEPVMLGLSQLAEWRTLCSPFPDGRALNDFVPGLLPLHGPAISRITTALEAAGAALTGMSGSGSTFFGVFADAPDTPAISRDTGFPVLATRTATRVDAVRYF